MSKNCVDATIELAYQYDLPMILIASRRQIECEELGGGYVNNWTSMRFAEYIRSNDPAGKIVLARDHGGPWQHPFEVDRYNCLSDAMTSAKLSFRRDIEAGFDILHIDPIIMNDFSSTTDKQQRVLEAVFELYDYCMGVAQELNRNIAFEIGTEEQTVNPLSDLEFFERTIETVVDFCKRRRYPTPLFFVVQTGTKVMGMRNIGEFPILPNAIINYFDKFRLTEIVDFCEKKGIGIKEHNTDYLPDSALQTHPGLGIHAANVAPEFGVAETCRLLSIMESLKLEKEMVSFIDVCVDSNKWYKWVEAEQAATDIEKAKICGHYLFSDPCITEIWDCVRSAYARQGKNLDQALKNAVKRSIMRYLTNFNMIHMLGRDTSCKYLAD
jgi:hypothetical protein